MPPGVLSHCTESIERRRCHAVTVITAPTGDCLLNRRDPHAKEQTEKTRDAVVKSLRELKHSVTVVEAGPTMLSDIESTKPDALFNIATGYRTKKDQANIAAILELTGIPFTGSSLEAHTIGLQKHLTKMVMQSVGIETPAFLPVFGTQDLDPGLVEGLRFPVIVKPAAEGSSVGIAGQRRRRWGRRSRDSGERVGAVRTACTDRRVHCRQRDGGPSGIPEAKALPVEEIVFNEDGMYIRVKSKDNVRASVRRQFPAPSGLSSRHCS